MSAPITQAVLKLIYSALTITLVVLPIEPTTLEVLNEFILKFPSQDNSKPS